MGKYISLKRYGYIMETIKVPKDTRVFYKPQGEEYKPNGKETIRGYEIFEHTTNK